MNFFSKKALEKHRKTQEHKQREKENKIVSLTNKQGPPMADEIFVKRASEAVMQEIFLDSGIKTRKNEWVRFCEICDILFDDVHIW